MNAAHMRNYALHVDRFIAHVDKKAQSTGIVLVCVVDDEKRPIGSAVLEKDELQVDHPYRDHGNAGKRRYGGCIEVHFFRIPYIRYLQPETQPGFSPHEARFPTTPPDVWEEGPSREAKLIAQPYLLVGKAKNLHVAEFVDIAVGIGNANLT